jgi:hypothetical protein
MIDAVLYRESGAISAGRGTNIEEVGTVIGAPEDGFAVDIDFRSSANNLALYYPHDAALSAPIIRPLNTGDLSPSFTHNVFWQISGEYEKIKNIRVKLMVGDAEQASKAMLFGRWTNSYVEPSADYTGTLLPLWDGAGFVNGRDELVFYPRWGTSPILATSRPIVVGPDATVQSQWLTLQLLSARGEEVGNSAEFILKLEFDEIGEL